MEVKNTGGKMSGRGGKKRLTGLLKTIQDPMKL